MRHQHTFTAALDFPAIAAAAEKLAERTLWPERARALRHVAADALHYHETDDPASLESVIDWLSEDHDLRARSFQRSCFGMGAGL